MRTIIVVIISFIICSNISEAQSNELDGFYKFKWGYSAEKVITVMNSKAKLTRQSDIYVEYEGGMFANLPVEIWQFEFIENKLYRASVIFRLPSMEIYNSLVFDLIKKYGKPLIVDEFKYEWLLTYTKNNKYKLSTLQCLAGNGMGFDFTEIISLIYFDNELYKEVRDSIKKQRMDEL